MNVVLTTILTLSLTIVPRALSLRFPWVMGFAVFGHLGLLAMHTLDIRGDKKSLSYQRSVAFFAFNVLALIEALTYLPWGIWILGLMVPLVMALALVELELSKCLLVVGTWVLLLTLNPYLAWLDKSTVIVSSVVGFVLLTIVKRKKVSHVETLQDKLKRFEYDSAQFTNETRSLLDATNLQDQSWQQQLKLLNTREKQFQSFVSILRSATKAHAAFVYLYDSPSGQFSLKAYNGPEICKIKTFAKKTEGIFAAAFASVGPLKISRKRQYPALFSYYESEVNADLVWAFPILDENQKRKALAFLDFKSDQDGYSDEIMRDLYASISSHVEELLKQSETAFTNFKLNQEVLTLYQASQELSIDKTSHDLYGLTLIKVLDIFPCSWALGLTYDRSAKSFRVIAEECEPGVNKSIAKQIPALDSATVLSWVVQKKKFLYLKNYSRRKSKYPLIHNEHPIPNTVASVAIWPILVSGEVEGILIFGSNVEDAMPHHVKQIVSVLSAQLGSTLGQKRMLNQLAEIATTDGLTGALNHRAFQDQLSDELDRAERTGNLVSLLMIDVDFFKKFNDEYGHQAGDLVLQRVSVFLQKLVRKIDFVARYGGEEFGLILPNTSGEQAMLLAQRIVQEVRTLMIPYKGLKLNVTLSAGVSTFPSPATKQADLIEQADRALYEAKRAGRNRALIFRPELKRVSLLSQEETLVDMTEEQLRRRFIDVKGQTA